MYSLQIAIVGKSRFYDIRNIHNISVISVLFVKFLAIYVLFLQSHAMKSVPLIYSNIPKASVLGGVRWTSGFSAPFISVQGSWRDSTHILQCCLAAADGAPDPFGVYFYGFCTLFAVMSVGPWAGRKHKIPGFLGAWWFDGAWPIKLKNMIHWPKWSESWEPFLVEI